MKKVTLFGFAGTILSVLLISGPAAAQDEIYVFDYPSTLCFERPSTMVNGDMYFSKFFNGVGYPDGYLKNLSSQAIDVYCPIPVKQAEVHRADDTTVIYENGDVTAYVMDNSNSDDFDCEVLSVSRDSYANGLFDYSTMEMVEEEADGRFRKLVAEDIDLVYYSYITIACTIPRSEFFSASGFDKYSGIGGYRMEVNGYIQ